MQVYDIYRMTSIKRNKWRIKMFMHTSVFHGWSTPYNLQEEFILYSRKKISQCKKKKKRKAYFSPGTYSNGNVWEFQNSEMFNSNIFTCKTARAISKLDMQYCIYNVNVQCTVMIRPFKTENEKCESRNLLRSLSVTINEVGLWNLKVTQHGFLRLCKTTKILLMYE